MAVASHRANSLGDVVATSAEASRVAVDGRKHNLTIDVGDEDLCVDGDFDRLTQMFVKLLDNAAKYTEEGGTVRFGLLRDGDDALITVANNGIGIHASERQASLKSPRKYTHNAGAQMVGSALVCLW